MKVRDRGRERRNTVGGGYMGNEAAALLVAASLSDAEEGRE